MLRIPTRHAPAAVVCLVLAASHTWPLITQPAALSLNSHADAALNEWILAWIAHQLPRAPLALFDANIFYPARMSLAFSEPLLLQGLAAAPLAWLGASPVIVYNLMLLAGLALTAFSAYALVFSWTQDRAAGLVAASAFAFNAHTLARLAHLQAIHLYGLPLLLFGIDRVIARPRVRPALWVACSLVVLAWTSGYLIVFGAVAAAVVLLVRVGEWRAHSRSVLTQLAVAAVVAAAAILPVYLAYRWVAREYSMGRTLEHVAQFSATLPGYVATPARLHAFWSGRFLGDPGVNAFFAGCVVILLATAAILLAHTNRRRVVALVAVAAAGVLLSLGTATPIYGWLFSVLPPMQSLRVASRFGNLYLLAMALLAGVGSAVIRRRITSRAVAALIGVVAIAAVNLESAVAPIRYDRFEGIPRIYALLTSEPDPVVLMEFPIPPPQLVHENAPYVLASTAHWRKLVNGYSGYVPASYRRLQPAFSYFPDPHAVQAMREAGVTHVMVHPSRAGIDGEKVIRGAEASPALERVALGPDGIRLFRLR